jgi:uncharacterized protein with HEPN domain
MTFRRLKPRWNVLKGQTRQSLDANLMLVFALIRAVEIMGEAASRLSAEAFKQAHQPAPGIWQDKVF